MSVSFFDLLFLDKIIILSRLIHRTLKSYQSNINICEWTVISIFVSQSSFTTFVVTKLRWNPTITWRQGKIGVRYKLYRIYYWTPLYHRKTEYWQITFFILREVLVHYFLQNLCRNKWKMSQIVVTMFVLFTCNARSMET